MALANVVTDDIVCIVEAGAGIILDRPRTADDFIRIATAAMVSGVRVVFRNLNVTLEDAVRIAAASRGCVPLE